MNSAAAFENPGVFFAFLLLIPLVILGTVRFFRRRKVLDLLSPEAAAGRLSSRYFLSSAFFLLFLGCVIAALAGPRWGIKLSPEFRRGAEVILALDLSRSMEVRDINPAAPGGGDSRLERAVTLARAVVENAGGLRFGVVVGKGMGVLAVPLTEDMEAVSGFLGSLSGAAVTGTGTNLEALLDAASGAFTGAFPARRRIILFSDGEALRGSLSAAVDRAAERDITVTVAALGSEAGGPVPGGPLGEEPPRREDGQGVISFLRSEALRSAALRTGGAYVDGGGEDAAARLSGDVSAAALDSASGGFKREIQSQGHLFILAALAALGLSKLFEKRFRRGA
jgi:Ca-activated chloride channel family protein